MSYEGPKRIEIRIQDESPDVQAIRECKRCGHMLAIFSFIEEWENGFLVREGWRWKCEECGNSVVAFDV